MKHLSRFCSALFSVIFLSASASVGQERDLEYLQSLTGTESRVMDTIRQFTDVFGARLTGTPALNDAGAWALDRLEEWGADRVYRHEWEWGHPGWQNARASVRVVEPWIDPVNFEVLAFTPGTDGPVSGDVVLVELPSDPTGAELDRFFAGIREDVRGKVVFIGRPSPVSFQTYPMRMDDEQAEDIFRPDREPEDIAAPRDSETLSSYEFRRRTDQFLRDAGALARVESSSREMGMIRATAGRTWDPEKTLPSIVLTSEEYGRIVRRMDAGTTVRMELDIENALFPEGARQYNYMAEIRGGDRPGEVVMLGGHLDSWHTSPGATDNATGVAVMMEAVRLIAQMPERPDRTIRIALWTGEEQGLLGSRAYVESTFGTAENPTDEHAGFGGYLNLDHGTGRIRGAEVFGSTETAHALDAILDPLTSLGVAGATATLNRYPGGSDHAAFNQAGLPGINFEQDPIQYYMHTWHSNADAYERIIEEDVRQAAIVAAYTIWQLANAPELLPRVPAASMPPWVARIR